MLPALGYDVGRWLSWAQSGRLGKWFLLLLSAFMCELNSHHVWFSFQEGVLAQEDEYFQQGYEFQRNRSESSTRVPSMVPWGEVVSVCCS